MIAHKKMMLSLMKAYPTEWFIFSLVVVVLVITVTYAFSQKGSAHE